ncbi:hypothetical protein NNJEOMEG_02682 [Fundidesulfovibrio magnetotacticus]|uniref:Uncharacterized protein n=1 Tax=Fundidesulfovibrio magnetotacticus TaxID=2730080 RepID=A0A6V8LSX4_9BACT|nr:hypothetical protein [Fundidesulfovibrio magnetotacticus]GFK94834.1 hypothetical protein NNJEOMEG_02682 [Fundidesulfovibrio magnetotacticus]
MLNINDQPRPSSCSKVTGHNNYPTKTTTKGKNTQTTHRKPILFALSILCTFEIYAYIFKIPANTLLFGLGYYIIFWLVPGLAILSTSPRQSGNHFICTFKASAIGYTLNLGAYFLGIYTTKELYFTPLAFCTIFLFREKRKLIASLLKKIETDLSSISTSQGIIFIIFVCAFLFSTTGYSYTTIPIGFDEHYLTASSFTHELASKFPLYIRYSETASQLLSYHIGANLIGVVFCHIFNQPTHYYTIYSIYAIGFLPLIIAIGCLCKTASIPKRYYLLTLYIFLFAREPLTGAEFITTAYFSQFFAEILVLGGIALLNNEDNKASNIITHIVIPAATICTRLPTGAYYCTILVVHKILSSSQTNKTKLGLLTTAGIFSIATYYTFYVWGSNVALSNFNPEKTFTPYHWILNTVSKNHYLIDLINNTKLSFSAVNPSTSTYIYLFVIFTPLCLFLFYTYNILSILLGRIYHIKQQPNNRLLLAYSATGFILASIIPEVRAITISIVAFHVSLIPFISTIYIVKRKAKNYAANIKPKLTTAANILLALPFVIYLMMPASKEPVSSYVGQAKYKYLTSTIPELFKQFSPELHDSIKRLFKENPPANMSPELYDILNQARHLVPADSIVIHPEHYRTRTLIAGIAQKKPYFEASYYSDPDAVTFQEYTSKLNSIANNGHVEKTLTSNKYYYILSNNLYNKIAKLYNLRLVAVNTRYAILQID